MEKEFKNDGTSDTRIPPKEKAREVAEIWGEGFEPLINLLEVCIENDVRTMGCCSGHPEQQFGYPYVYFENKTQIAHFILEQMSKERSTDKICITRNVGIGVPAFVLTSTIEYREEFFNKITEYIERYIEQNKETKKITGAKTTEELSKKSEDIRIMRRISLLTEKENFGSGIVYEPRYKLFHFDGKDKDYKYSEAEMRRKSDQEFLVSEELMEKEPLIDKIQHICENSKVRFSKIREAINRISRINCRNRKNKSGTINSS